MKYFPVPKSRAKFRFSSCPLEKFRQQKTGTDLLTSEQQPWLPLWNGKQMNKSVQITHTRLTGIPILKQFTDRKNLKFSYIGKSKTKRRVSFMSVDSRLQQSWKTPD